MVLMPDSLTPSRGATHLDIRCLHVAEGYQLSGVWLRVFWSTFNEISGCGLGSWSPVSHRRRPGSVQRQSMWGFWWTSSDGTGFPTTTLISLVGLFLSEVHARSFIYNRRFVFLAVDSVVRQRALIQNSGGGTVVKRWLLTRKTDFRQRGIENPFHDVVSAIPLASTMLKICGMTVTWRRISPYNLPWRHRGGKV